MKSYIQRSICIIMVVFLFTAFYSCNDKSKTTSGSNESETASSVTSENKLSGKYYQEGTQSGYEFKDDKVLSIANGVVQSENNYEIKGNKLIISFAGDGVQVESLEFTLSDDKSYFTGTDHEGTYKFIKQND